jgi:hypothetical protein
VPQLVRAPVPVPPAANNNQDNDGENPPPQPVDNRGVVGEISDIVIPFFTSLWPTWTPDVVHAQPPPDVGAPVGIM